MFLSSFAILTPFISKWQISIVTSKTLLQYWRLQPSCKRARVEQLTSVGKFNSNSFPIVDTFNLKSLVYSPWVFILFVCTHISGDWKATVFSK